jgi:S1-C subfamily serine protease
MPKQTSGAPILDRTGAVVGINTGPGHFAGHEFGPNSLSSIRAQLEGALSARRVARVARDVPDAT